MTWIEHARMRFAHNEWANNKLLAAAEGLTDAELTAKRSGSYGNLAEDLIHIVDAEVWWYSVASETKYERRSALPESAVMDALRGSFAEWDGKWRALLETLGDDDLPKRLRVTSRGREEEYVRWQVLEHVAGHGTHHRGEIGQALRELDRSPGDTDFLDYVESVQ